MGVKLMELETNFHNDDELHFLFNIVGNKGVISLELDNQGMTPMSMKIGEINDSDVDEEDINVKLAF